MKPPTATTPPSPTTPVAPPPPAAPQPTPPAPEAKPVPDPVEVAKAANTRHAQRLTDLVSAGRKHEAAIREQADKIRAVVRTLEGCIRQALSVNHDDHARAAQMLKRAEATYKETAEKAAAKPGA